ncbi:MAG TPA: CotH kinase family protein [bacterium]|nr:CotH kinase family protein [bacterium]HPN44048.1 CotH kinase family protein [bacterium]
MAFKSFILTAIILLLINACLYPQDIKLAVSSSIIIPGYDEPYTSSNLPIVLINTNGQPIPDDEVRIIADMGIIDNGKYLRNNLTDPMNGYLGKIRIEIRGESSTSWSKKQYNIETVDSFGKNRNVSLLGMPVENDWILNGPFIDKSFMRNVITFKLARDMRRYASRTRFCELVLNGEYRGIYILMEKIKRDADRVDIASLGQDDNQGIDVTGGYILRIDKMDAHYQPGAHYFISRYLQHPQYKQKTCYQFRYPEFDVITRQQKDYIIDYINDFEDVMYANNYADPDSGYSRFIDVSSFIDGFILCELSKNVDSYRLSSYFYKDKGGKLNMGPLWDFNLAYGLANYYDADDTDDWMIDTLSTPHLMGRYDQLAQFWWRKLFHDKAFAAALYQRWLELRSTSLREENIYRFIDANADTLTEAQERNFAIWSPPGQPGEGFWPVPPAIRSLKTFQDEVNYIKTWLGLRIAWMDANLPILTGITAANQSVQPVQNIDLIQNYPNPFNDLTCIQFYLSAPADIKLEILNLAGQTVTILLAGRRPAGTGVVHWNAITNNGEPVGSGMYISRLTVIIPEHPPQVQIRKILLVK